MRAPRFATPQNLKLGKEKGGELRGSVNNYSLKRVDQTFIQIKCINVHRINLIDLFK
jgi:hypothetical protein